MTDRIALPDEVDFAAALDWWREAGVTNDFGDDATAWLAEPKEEPERQASQPSHPPALERQLDPEPKDIAKFGGERSKWPGDLAAFAQWWMEEPSLDAGGTGPRVAPRGSVGASLMIIVAEPERDDRDRLLAGEQGRVLDGFLRAAGIAEEQYYLASALPRAVPMPDWPGLKAAGLGDLLEHHVRLVDPKRILVFGRNILPLIGNPSAQGSAVLREFNHEGRSVPVMGCRGLSELLRKAAAREQLWKRWLDWTDG